MPLLEQNASGRGSAAEPQLLNVLIVDDEPADAALLERTLSQVEGFRFRTSRATDLSSARAATAADAFDLAMIDFDVGGQCGVDLVPQLATRRGTCAPILVTGHLTQSVRERALKAGVMASLSKDGLDARLVEIAIRQALQCLDLNARLSACLEEVERLRQQKVDLTAALPTHLMLALRHLLASVTGIEQGIAAHKPASALAAEARAMRYLADDLNCYCEDTLAVYGAIDGHTGRTASVDLQSVLLDAARRVGDVRRRKAITFDIGFHGNPLYVSADESVLRYALTDMLSVALESVMPGARLDIGFAVRDGEVLLITGCEDVILRHDGVKLSNSRLVSRCQALLDRCGGRVVFSTTTRRGGRIAELRLPHAPGRRAVAGIQGAKAIRKKDVASPGVS